MQINLSAVKATSVLTSFWCAMFSGTLTFLTLLRKVGGVLILSGFYELGVWSTLHTVCRNRGWRSGFFPSLRLADYNSSARRESVKRAPAQQVSKRSYRPALRHGMWCWRSDWVDGLFKIDVHIQHPAPTTSRSAARVVDGFVDAVPDDAEQRSDA